MIVNKEKCLFGKSCLNFLGHNIKEKGIQAAEENSTNTQVSPTNYHKTNAEIHRHAQLLQSFPTEYRVDTQNTLHMFKR